MTTESLADTQLAGAKSKLTTNKCVHVKILRLNTNTGQTLLQLGANLDQLQTLSPLFQHGHIGTACKFCTR